MHSSRQLLRVGGWFLRDAEDQIRLCANAVLHNSELAPAAGRFQVWDGYSKLSPLKLRSPGPCLPRTRQWRRRRRGFNDPCTTLTSWTPWPIPENSNGGLQWVSPFLRTRLRNWPEPELLEKQRHLAVGFVMCLNNV